jgi:hypothetical protein
MIVFFRYALPAHHQYPLDDAAAWPPPGVDGPRKAAAGKSTAVDPRDAGATLMGAVEL